MFMRPKHKFFIFSVSTVANQRMPTVLALKLRKVESLLLRHMRSNPINVHGLTVQAIAPMVAGGHICGPFTALERCFNHIVKAEPGLICTKEGDWLWAIWALQRFQKGYYRKGDPSCPHDIEKPAPTRRQGTMTLHRLRRWCTRLVLMRFVIVIRFGGD
jgi:hypothetical protein